VTVTLCSTDLAGCSGYAGAFAAALSSWYVDCNTIIRWGMGPCGAGGGVVLICRGLALARIRSWHRRSIGALLRNAPRSSMRHTTNRLLYGRNQSSLSRLTWSGRAPRVRLRHKRQKPMLDLSGRLSNCKG
jgi:hypothetical protein